MQINELCARHYNSHCLRDSSGKLDFQIGDKVCPRRNTECFDAYEEKKERKKEVSVKLCNGEVFFIKDIIEEQDNRSKKITYFVIDNGERIMKIDFKMLKRAKLSHAWARTIHTYQGSEIDTVVYVVGSPFYQNWQHVYTAVTRGVRRVVIINNPDNLERAVTALPIPRQTKLEDDILQAMVNNGCDDVLSDSEDFIADDQASQISTPGSDLANEGANPSRKRKLSESPANIGVPQTPPRFGVGASPSSHVSPSISPSPEHSNQTGETPTKTRKPFIARFNSPCKVCKSPIKAGEHEIAPLDDGRGTAWIHAKCRDEKQDTK